MTRPILKDLAPGRTSGLTGDCRFEALDQRWNSTASAGRSPRIGAGVSEGRRLVWPVGAEAVAATASPAPWPHVRDARLLGLPGAVASCTG